MGRGRILLAFATVLAGCSLEVEYGTGYRCIDDTDCPGDQRCVVNTCQAAGSPDAAAPFDAPAPSDTGPDAARVNLLDNPGFETDEDTWGRYNSTLVRTSAVPHEGQWSGHVCQISADSPFTVFQTLESNPPEGASYVARAWVRSGDAETISARLTIREVTGEVWIDYDGDTVAIDGEWVELSVEGTVQEPGREAAQVIVWGLSGGGPCFDVDDTFGYLTGS